MRFANRVIEPLLCATHVDQVQITVAETLGVEGRYRYYDGIGALRDMIQNHLIQLFCLSAMDPPAVWDAEVLRDHKVEILRSVRQSPIDVTTWAARGQYGSGTQQGAPVDGYRDEPGIDADTTTETFAAVRLQVDNWRWQGVPFYLRSGKRLGAKVSEIAYRFREPPTQLFDHAQHSALEPNWLIFRLDQPEGIDLFVQTKTPGLEMTAERSHLHTDYGTTTETVTAYQQLLLDVLEGDHTPFLRVDEIDWAWHILDPILEAWSRGQPQRYPAGSDGPTSQGDILLPGHTWRPLPS
jgi:glucose-6-phosphate 1-dehydrogenase